MALQTVKTRAALTALGSSLSAVLGVAYVSEVGYEGIYAWKSGTSSWDIVVAGKDAFDSMLGSLRHESCITGRLPIGGETIMGFLGMIGNYYPENMQDSVFYVSNVPAASLVCPISVGGTSIGNVTVAAGSHYGTFSTTAYTFVSRLPFTIQAPSVVDATASDIFISILGQRSA